MDGGCVPSNDPREGEHGIGRQQTRPMRRASWQRALALTLPGSTVRACSCTPQHSSSPWPKLQDAQAHNPGWPGCQPRQLGRQRGLQLLRSTARTLLRASTNRSRNPGARPCTLRAGDNRQPYLAPQARNLSQAVEHTRVRVAAWWAPAAPWAAASASQRCASHAASNICSWPTAHLPATMSKRCCVPCTSGRGCDTPSPHHVSGRRRPLPES